MASIHAHPLSKHWIAHLTIGDKRTSRSTRIEATESNRKKAQALADMWDQAGKRAASGQDPRAWAISTLNDILGAQNAPTVHVDTFTGTVERFLAERRRVKRKDTTLSGYDWTVRSFTDHLGSKAGRNIALVTSTEVERWVTSLLKSMTSASASVRFTQLRAIFNYAHRHGLITINPAAAVPGPDRGGESKEPFTVEEVGRLLEHLRTRERHTAIGRDLLTLSMLGLCTGARIGDCATMKWENIDLARGTVSFLPMKKSRAGKLVTMALAHPLRAHLETLDSRAGPLCPSFSSHQRPPAHAGTHFGRLLDRAGAVTRDRVTEGRGRAFNTKSFHSFRHTLSTWLAAAGVDDLVRRRITDHEDKKVAAIYQHVSIEATGRALAAVLDPLRLAG